MRLVAYHHDHLYLPVTLLHRVSAHALARIASKDNAFVSPSSFCLCCSASSFFLCCGALKLLECESEGLSADMLAPVPLPTRTWPCQHAKASCSVFTALAPWLPCSLAAPLVALQDGQTARAPTCSCSHARPFPHLPHCTKRHDQHAFMSVCAHACLASALEACGLAHSWQRTLPFSRSLSVHKTASDGVPVCRLLETTTNVAIETLRHELEGSKKEVLLPLLVLVRSVLSYAITLLGQKQDCEAAWVLWRGDLGLLPGIPASFSVFPATRCIVA